MSGLLSVVLIVLVLVAVSLLGLALVRRLVPHDRLAQHTDVAGYVYAVIGVIYAVILAQVVIAGWEQYRDARSVAAAEANAVLNLARLAQVWDGEERTRVEQVLSDYAGHVVDVEWPAMQQGVYDPSLHSPFLHDVWQAVRVAAAGAGNDDADYAASLQQLDLLDEARRSRVLLGEGGLPEAMTLTLIVGAIVTVGFS